MSRGGLHFIAAENFQNFLSGKVIARFVEMRSICAREVIGAPRLQLEPPRKKLDANGSIHLFEIQFQQRASSFLCTLYIYAIIFNSRESILIQMHDVMFFEIIAAASLCFGCGVHQVSRAQILPDFPNRPPNWPAERGRRIIIRPPGSPSQLRPNIRPAIRENCYLIQNKY